VATNVVAYVSKRFRYWKTRDQDTAKQRVNAKDTRCTKTFIIHSFTFSWSRIYR